MSLSQSSKSDSSAADRSTNRGKTHPATRWTRYFETLTQVRAHNRVEDHDRMDHPPAIRRRALPNLRTRRVQELPNANTDRIEAHCSDDPRKQYSMCVMGSFAKGNGINQRCAGCRPSSSAAWTCKPVGATSSLRSDPGRHSVRLQERSTPKMRAAGMRGSHQDRSTGDADGSGRGRYRRCDRSRQGRLAHRTQEPTEIVPRTSTGWT